MDDQLESSRDIIGNQVSNGGAISLVTISVAALGWAVNSADGSATPESMAVLSIAFFALFGSALLFWKKVTLSEQFLTYILASAVAAQFVLLITRNPLFRVHGLATANYYSGSICLAAFLTGSLLVLRGSRQRIVFACLLSIFVITASWLLWLGPIPKIDLVVYHKLGIRALLEGVSPYTSIYPDIYTPAESVTYYGPGLSKDGVLQVGYPYLPLALLLSAPAEILLGDFRLAELFALLATAYFIGYARPSAWSFPVATIFLFTPLTFFFLAHGWMEPFILMLLGFSAWSYYRAKSLLPFALGLLCASKQYLIIAAPLVLLLAPRPLSDRAGRVFLAKVLLTGCLATLPVVLIDPGAFVHSAVWMFLRAPYRVDSLSYVTWFSLGGQEGFPILGFIVPLGILFACLLRGSPTFVGFLTSFVAVMLPFFALNKQAFANYYHLIIGALCLLASLLAGDGQISSVTRKAKRLAALESPLERDEELVLLNGAEPSLSA